MGASAAGGDYEIDNSLRFNGLSEARLNRTPSSASNQKTWTYSVWVKLGKGYSGGSGGDLFFGGASNSTLAKLQINDGDYGTKDSLWMSFDGGSAYLSENTTALFRDPSAWYHIVWVLDTTISTATDRVKLYVNGVRLTSFTSVFAASSFNSVGQNSNWGINSTTSHSIGGANNYFDGYLAEVNFIDGQALTPDSFGETGDYGEWKAKSYAGGYGTNGFYLDFKSSGSLGNDAAGSNNWTIHNLAATDQMLDSPTNNFCTMNPLRALGAVAYSEGNCWSGLPAGDNTNGAVGTFAPSSGKWYWEATSTHTPTLFGIADSAAAQSILKYSGVGMTSYYLHTGAKWISGVSSSYGASGSAGDIIGTALDMDNRTIQFFKNGSSLGAAFTIAAGANMAPACFGANVNNVKTVRWNFGADSSFAGLKTPQGNPDSNGIGDFYYAPPSGFLALCTKSLPSVDVIPSENFNTVLYTGNGADNHAITGVGFQPDFVWMKSRNAARSHALVDSVRGRGSILFSDSSDAQQVPAAANNDLVSFNTDGFTVGTPERAGSTNTNNDTIVAWNWKLGGSAVSNSNGSVTSQVSANVDAGISIATFTLPTTATTIGHGLSKPPELIFQKGRVSGSAWWTFHKDIGNTKAIRLDSSGAAGGANSNFWNNTDPTSTVVTIGANSGGNNSWLMYCFHSVEGYSLVSSYVGNGSTDGVYVHCGFSPAVIITKSLAATGWRTIDNKRTPYNPSKASLYPDSTDAEYTGTGHETDFTANGFKMRNSNSRLNTSGQEYIFYAIAESPFKFSNAR